MVGPMQVLNPDGREALVPLKPQVVPFIKPMNPKAMGNSVCAFALTEGGVNHAETFSSGGQ